VVWDAKKMNTVFDELPLGEGYSASIQSASSVLLQNASSFNAIEMHSMQKSGNTALSVHQNDTTWRVLTNEFKTVQLWMVIAVPEKTILKPVKDLMLYLTLFIIGLAFMMFLLGWMLSLQIKRPIASLTNDVQRLSNLDFTQTIQIPAMKDLLGLGEAIEQMRQSLERHQHLHHESNHADSGEDQDGNSNRTLS
jgi:HAMP domain-containing protein